LLKSTTGSAQGVVNTSSVANVPIPIPPYEEQQEIIEIMKGKILHMENIKNIVARINISHDNLLCKLQTLSKRILDVGFSGKLIN
jgi:restriction endonuclease S subunit